ncbi:MAG: hypothetical protein EHM24_23420 [Acidobacteria bacterium]|nr:MAG: hypothetical protein EHM24_23420 [Acidobacteriota bacterium]
MPVHGASTSTDRTRRRAEGGSAYRPTAYCLLPTAYCLLPTAYCLLPTISSAYRYTLHLSVFTQL